MKCTCCSGCFLATDPLTYVIEVGGKRLHFEMHPYSGPAALDASGEIARKQPGPRHPLWTAVTLWAQQGRKVGDDGLCVWEPPAEAELVHLGGRNYAVAGSALAKKHGINADAGQLPARTTGDSHG